MENRTEDGYAVFGSVWKQGERKKEDGFRLLTGTGEERPVQSRITAWYPDGSVKWAAHRADSRELTESVVLEKGDRKEPEKRIEIRKEQGVYSIDAGRVTAEIPEQGGEIFRNLRTDGKLTAESAEELLILEKRQTEGETLIRREVSFIGETVEVLLEEEGPLCAVFRLSGVHKNKETGEVKLPFIIRLTFGLMEPSVQITHTFLYDGNENEDFLKGIGMRVQCPIAGRMYNRHVKFLTDHGAFHESLAMLLSWRPRVPKETYSAQMDGKILALDPEKDAAALEAAAHMPIWGEYRLLQDSPSHFSVRKKVGKDGLCYLESLHGNRAPGCFAAAGEDGGVMISGKDFWQKYPQSLAVKQADRDCFQAEFWFWSPDAEAMDFRHYADEGYSQTYYEGFDEVKATPYGIANTNEFSLMGFTGEIPSDAEMKEFHKKVQKPAIYLADPEYYHETGAFGVWGLKKTESGMERWLEDQLNRAFEFYQKEIDVRNWYGLFNYGDVMHTYDPTRHCWRYDMGGYAWQNTELVPTLWLWLYFLRTGREDVFTLAEAMSRHCSEVDVYHFGPYKGIGSRHNVRHWGCSCKEARIAMAGHHRYYYYLTGDPRIGDVMEDVKDGDQALLNIDPLRHFYDKETMVYPTHARTGPDWSSLCSDWMTQWERTGDPAYEKKIRTGIADIRQAPLKLVSGSNFEYNPADSHLRYIGENAAGGTHLTVCMGAPQTWFELAELLGDEEWKQMLADYGRFYYLSREEQLKQSNGLFGERESSLPYMAAAMAAYGAAYYQDRALAEKTWKILLETMERDGSANGFQASGVPDAGNQEMLEEISWISTNYASQWCLNVIMALGLIRDALPDKR